MSDRDTTVHRRGGKRLSAFPYPGGKTSYVDEIVQYFQEHRRYVEPFGGSAAVLLNKPRSYIEVFNDINQDIVHFFKVLRDRREELQEWLRHCPYSRDLHEQWAREHFDGERPDDEVERAGRWFYLRYTQYGGKVDRFSGFKTSIKRNEARSLRGAIQHLDQVVDRLQEVTIENQDYRQVVERYDRPDTLFYFDPPYVEADYNYYGTGRFNHQQLVECLDSIDGRWLCSYGDLPDGLREVATTVVEFTAHYSLNTGNNEERKESAEHLAMNFDPRDEPLFTVAEQTTLDALAEGSRKGTDTDHSPRTDSGCNGRSLNPGGDRTND